MNSYPMNHDGSDAPSSIQAPPPGYKELKESLKGALLLLAELDQASLAMLKHDEEYQHAVQTFLVPLSSTPVSEIVERAMKTGLDAIVSDISTHIHTTTHPTPQVARDPTPNSSAGDLVSLYEVHLSGGEWNSQNPAEGLVDLLNLELDAIRIRRKALAFRRGLPLDAGPSMLPSAEPQDRVIEAFMAQGGRAKVVLVCTPQTSYFPNALLDDLQEAIDRVGHGILADRKCKLTTYIAISNLEREIALSAWRGE